MIVPGRRWRGKKKRGGGSAEVRRRVYKLTTVKGAELLWSALTKGRKGEGGEGFKRPLASQEKKVTVKGHS